jgi:hypothetical protein
LCNGIRERTSVFPKMRRRVRAACNQRGPKSPRNASVCRLVPGDNYPELSCCLIQECSRAGRALPHQNAPVAASECQSDSDMSPVISTETASKPFAGRGRRGQGPKPAPPVREAQPLRPARSLSIIRLPSAGDLESITCHDASSSVPPTSSTAKRHVTKPRPCKPVICLAGRRFHQRFFDNRGPEYQFARPLTSPLFHPTL